MAAQGEAGAAAQSEAGRAATQEAGSQLFDEEEEEWDDDADLQDTASLRTRAAALSLPPSSPSRGSQEQRSPSVRHAASTLPLPLSPPVPAHSSLAALIAAEQRCAALEAALQDAKQAEMDAREEAAAHAEAAAAAASGLATAADELARARCESAELRSSAEDAQHRLAAAEAGNEELLRALCETEAAARKRAAAAASMAAGAAVPSADVAAAMAAAAREAERASEVPALLDQVTSLRAGLDTARAELAREQETHAYQKAELDCKMEENSELQRELQGVRSELSLYKRCATASPVATEASASPPSPKRRRKALRPWVRIACSGFLQGSQKREINKLIARVCAKLGGELVDLPIDRMDGPSVTHIVAAAPGIRTIKSVGFLLLNRWLVTKEWVEASEAAGQWLPEADFGCCMQHGGICTRRVFHTPGWRKATPRKRSVNCDELIRIGGGVPVQDPSQADVVFTVAGEDLSSVPIRPDAQLFEWDSFLSWIHPPCWKA